MIFFGLLLYWIRLFGWPAYFALVGLQALFAAAAIALPSYLPKNVRGPAFVAAFALAEYVRAHVPLGGFGWGGAGYTQHDNLLALRTAAYGGVWLVGIQVLIVNVLTAAAILQTSGGKLRRPFVMLIVAGMALVVPIFFPEGVAEGHAARVAMVQGNVPEDTLDPNADDLTVLRSHVELTEGLADERPSLVVWAESAFDRDPFLDPRLFDPLVEVITKVDAPFLVGATVAAEDASRGELLNTSLFFDSNANPIDRYEKQKIVPFGERVPLRSVFEPLIDELDRVPLDVAPGRSSTVFEIPEGKFGSVICYESTYPALVRSFVRNGARLLVVSTNNSSFGRTAASSQHVAFSQLRAAENHMWVAHTAISGISAVIAPDGRVVAATGLFERTLLIPTMRFASRTTFYASAGDWVPVSAAAALVVMLILGLRRKGDGSDERRREPAAGTLLVIPTFNEAHNIIKLLESVRSRAGKVSVLVVDDGSPDGTADRAQEFASKTDGVEVMKRTAKAGLGRAYVAGFKWGLERSFDRFIEMDADFSHDPGDVPRLLAAADHADVAIGSRYIAGGGVVGWARGRHLLSLGGNIFNRLMLGFSVKDSTSGFRCYSREVLEAIGLDSVKSDGYAFQIDMTYRAWQLGYRIVEIPIVFREREVGTSKMSRAIVGEAIASVVKWGLRDVFRHRRRSSTRVR